MNNNISIEVVIKKTVENLISTEIDKEIENKVNEFKQELISRKDKYIAEVMNGIRILHERDFINNIFNYKIIFENKYFLEKSDK